MPNFEIKTIEWDGVEGWSKDIEIPLSDIHCMVLGINGVFTIEGREGELIVYQGAPFMWGQTSIPYYMPSYKPTTPAYVAQASYPQPNILHLVGAGQSTAQCFNTNKTHYTMVYIVLPEIT